MWRRGGDAHDLNQGDWTALVAILRQAPLLPVTDVLNTMAALTQQGSWGRAEALVSRQVARRLELLQQLLMLTPAQIERLPPDQRQQVLALQSQMGGGR